MIIYGWGNFNRRDPGVVRGTCQACGHRGYQQSYTSSKFFTLYFIPVIPLGTQKIVSDCPHCKKAFGMPLRKWRKLRQTELPEAIAAYETNPSSEEAAKTALGAIFSLQDRAGLRRIGPQIRRAFAQNAAILTQLAGTYGFLCLDQEADDAYLAAVALSDDTDIHAEANRHIELQKLRRPAPPNRLLQSLPVLIMPAALLFAFTLFVQRAATSGLDQAYVLSGLDRPYTATINGRKVALAPHQRIPGDMLVYGKNEITPGAESPFIEAGSFEINAPWYRRAFGGPLVVVNPDQAAVLMWERSGYAKGTVPDDAYQYRAASGRTVHVHDDIDYAFLDFPSSITTSSSGGVIYKYRLSAFGAHEPQQVVQLLLGSQLPEDLQRYLRARLRAEDEDAGLIFLGASLLPREDFIHLAEARLAARPVLIQWHRAYQGVVEGTPEGRDLAGRYRTFVEQDPANSALVYLLSRVIEDPDECIASLRRAAALPNPTGYAAFGLAYRHMIDGNFAAALEYADEALRLEPGNVQFKGMRIVALYGRKDFTTVEKEAGNLLTSPDTDIDAFYEHVFRLGKLDQVGLARSEIPLFLQLQHKDGGMDEERGRSITAYLESALAIATRDRAAFIAVASHVEDPSWALQKAILAGELDEALRLAQATPDAVGLLEHLTLYILLDRASRAGDASVQLDQAIAELAVGSADQRRWAGWLRGDVAPPPRLAAHACDNPEAHDIFLSALAQKFPARAGEYLARAAAMKFKDTFHSLALDPVLPR